MTKGKKKKKIGGSNPSPSLEKTSRPVVPLVRGKGPPDDSSSSLRCRQPQDRVLNQHSTPTWILTPTCTLWKPDQALLFFRSQMHIPRCISCVPWGRRVLLATQVSTVNALLKLHYCCKIQRFFSKQAELLAVILAHTHAPGTALFNQPPCTYRHTPTRLEVVLINMLSFKSCSAVL